MTCLKQIFRDENGNITKVLANNGEVSDLYLDLVAETGDMEAALQMWAATKLDNFDSKLFERDENGEPDFRYVLYVFGKQKYQKIKDSAEPKKKIADEQSSHKSPRAQKEIAEELIRESSRYNLVETEESGRKISYYLDEEGREYQRVSDFKDQVREGYYAFSGKDVYEKERQWGNTVDKVFQGVIQGKSRLDIVNDVKNRIYSDYDISSASINNVIDKIQELKQLYPDSIFLSQIVIGNADVGLAGTMDLVVIEPNSEVHIFDLKSSKNPITRSYTKEDASGNEYKEFYDKVYIDRRSGKPVKKASKKAIHNVQLSIYKGLLESKLDLEVSKIGIIPAHLNSIGPHNEINNLIFEDTYEHSPDERLTKLIKLNRTKEFIINNLEDYSNTRFIEEIIAILRTEQQRLEKEGKLLNVSKIQALIEKIELGNEIASLSAFIEYTYNEFVTSDESLTQRFKTFLKEYKEGKYPDDVEVIQELAGYQQEVTIFSDIVKELQNFYEDEIIENDEKITIEKDSPLNKLNEIKVNFDFINRNIEKNREPILADILSRHLPSSENKKTMEKNLGLIKKRLSKPNLSEKAKVRLEKRKEELTYRLNLSNESLLDMIKNGSTKDISLTSMYLNPGISVDNALIATFMKTLKEAFEKQRAKLFNLERAAIKAFEDYKKVAKTSSSNVEKFNEPFYEVKEYENTTPEGEVIKKKRYSFVQPLDFKKYKNAMAKLAKEVQEEVDAIFAANEDVGIDSRTLFVQKYYAKSIKLGYRKERPLEDITVTNPYTGEVVRINKGVKTLINEARESKTAEQFRKWYNKNVTVVGGKEVFTSKLFTLPNEEMFSNDKYHKMNAAEKKYYDFLISTYLSAQDKVFDSTRLLYDIPGIEKISNDRLREKGIKNWFKRYWEKNTSFLEEEEEEYGQAKKVVPHLYKQDIGFNNTSLDLISSVLRYSAAAHKHEAAYRMKDVGEALLESAKLNPPQQKAGSNVGLIKKGAVGRMLNKYSNKHNGNNVAAMLEALIDTHIYGRYRNKANWAGWNKVTDAAIGFASVTQIGGKPLLAVANSLAAHISTAIDSWSKEYINPKTWYWAKLEYRKHEPSFMKDMLSPGKKSLIGQLTEIYDALQGEYLDQYGRKISQNEVKRMWGGKFWFSAMHKGEHAAQVKVLMSLLKEKKVKNTKTGKYVSLYDAYELDKNGVIKVKDNIDSPLIDAQLQNTVHSLNKRFNGIYNSFDRPLIERDNIGKLLLLYRKFVVPGFRRRFKRNGLDYEIGDEYEGYYTTFWRLVTTETKELLSAFSEESNLTNHEKANLRRVLTEFTYMIILSTVVSLLAMLHGEGDDDDEDPITDKAISLALYWSMRSLSELSLYNFGLGVVDNFLLPINPGGTLRTFRTPSPIWSVVTKSLKLFDVTGQSLLGLEGAYYQRNENYFVPFIGNLADKGDPKVKVQLMKTLGMNGYLYNTDNAIKILKIYN